MYDLIVVGAGVAGCMAARRVAFRGYKVLLVDREPRSSLGHPWINGVESKVFPLVGIDEPSGEETVPRPRRSRIVSPSGKHWVEVGPVTNFEVRMQPFTRRLLAKAERAGVEFRDLTQVEGPLVEKGVVRGVIAGGEEIPARLVLDASGWEAVVRRGLPESSIIPREIDTSCLVTAWREQRRFAPEEVGEVPGVLGIPPGVAISRLGWRGGYSTLSLHWDPGERILDVLVGYKKESSEETAGEFVQRFLEEKGLKGEFLYGGGGLIPVRRALDVLVDHGVLIAGDAACMAIPAHGSGTASALIAGNLAAVTIARCLEAGEFGRENLWEYAAAYQHGRGAMMAYFDVARMISEGLDSEGMEKLVKYFITPRAVTAGLQAETYHFTWGDLRQVVGGLRDPRFAARFAYLAALAPRLMKAYEEYPRRYHPRELRSWRERVRRILRPLGRGA
jgi:flavin-dependent dehydrogenase